MAEDVDTFENVNTIENVGSKYDDIGPWDSASRQGSNTSSVRSARIKAAAKQASLKARIKAMGTKHMLQQNELKVQHDLQMVELQAELDAATAEEEVLRSFDVSMPKLSLVGSKPSEVTDAPSTPPELHSPSPMPAPTSTDAALQLGDQQRSVYHSDSGRTFVNSNAPVSQPVTSHTQTLTPNMTVQTHTVASHDPIIHPDSLPRRTFPVMNNHNNTPNDQFHAPQKVMYNDPFEIPSNVYVPHSVFQDNTTNIPASCYSERAPCNQVYTKQQIPIDTNEHHSQFC